MAERRRSGYASGASHPEDASHEGRLYIAREIPGSARDNLRDQNRRGYGADSPKPLLQNQKKKVNAEPVRPEGFLDVLIREYRRDKLAAVLCVVLGILVLTVGAVWMQQAARSREERRAIETFQVQTQAFERENLRLKEEIERAKHGENIRNQAMNNLGMLRPERAETQEIFIRLPEEETDLSAPEVEETHFEFLDVLLGILHLLHIGA